MSMSAFGAVAASGQLIACQAAQEHHDDRDARHAASLSDLHSACGVAHGAAHVRVNSRRGYANNVGPLILRWADNDILRAADQLGQ